MFLYLVSKHVPLEHMLAFALNLHFVVLRHKHGSKGKPVTHHLSTAMTFLG